MPVLVVLTRKLTKVRQAQVLEAFSATNGWQFDTIQDLQHLASKPATISSSLDRLKKQTTMIKPIESIFISNKINNHSDGFIKSIPGMSFSRTKNLF